MTEHEKAMASRVREWLARKASRVRNPFQITVKDLEASLQTDHAGTKQVSAALSKLAKLGHLKVVGRRNDRVSPKGTSRPFVYEVTDPDKLAADLQTVPARRKPASYERVVMNPPGRSVQIEGVQSYSAPNGGDTWFADRNPTLANAIVNDLIGVGVNIETNGLTRQAGLELLRLTERVFRGAK